MENSVTSTREKALEKENKILVEEIIKLSDKTRKLENKNTMDKEGGVNMEEVSSVSVTLTREATGTIALEYLALGDLFDVHKGAEYRAENLQALKKGDVILIRVVETKTGNSISTAITH